MAATPSTMLRLGTIAPDFELPDVVSGRIISLNNLPAENGTVVMFICNHCPYVIHVNHEIVRIANDYIPRGFGFVAISSNDITQYPEDSPDRMRQVAGELGYPFPYLFDDTQDVAKQYHAACTPEFYLFDTARKLVYRGQLDDSRPANGIPVTGRDLRAAMDAILAGEMPDANQTPSIGCSIKWKK